LTDLFLEEFRCTNYRKALSFEVDSIVSVSVNRVIKVKREREEGEVRRFIVKIPLNEKVFENDTDINARKEIHGSKVPRKMK
jgi:hypothetical protein